MTAISNDIAMLATIIVENKGEARLKALATAIDATRAVENRKLIGENLRLLTALVSVIVEDKGEARVKAIGTICNLSLDVDNRKLMGESSIGLLTALVDVIRDDKEAREKALGATWNLSCNPDNRKLMSEPSLGLLAALVSVIVEDDGESRVKALITSYNLSCDPDNRKLMGEPSLGLLVALVSVIEKDTGTARIKALSNTWNLSIGPDNKKQMGEESLGLLAALVHVIRVDQGEARCKAIGTIGNLSCDPDIKKQMGESPELLAVLVDIIREDKGEARIRALGATYNLSSGPYIKKLMGESSIGLLEALLVILDEDKGEARVKALGTVWNLSVSLENTESFCNLDLHNRLFNLLNDPTAVGELREKLMTTIMVYCRHPPAARALRAIPGAIDVISGLTHDAGATGLKAAFILSQLVGRDESNSRANTQSLLQSRPATLDQLVDVLENNVALRDGADYHLGNFDLNAVTSAILSLCTSDANKAIMVKSRRLLELLVQLLEAFISNSPHYKRDGRGTVGGGGDDKETAMYVVFSLLQLSFYYPDDQLLVSEYMTADLNLVELLQQLLNLPADRQLKSNAVKSAANLLMRLHCRLNLTESLVSSAKREHVMISYSWGANKHLVVKLQRELTKLGYDVWRDEVGSTCVPAMSGAVDDRMAEAIEASYAVIICVSPQYKESANCQMEAKYCNALHKKKKLNLHYVMMDTDYHTNSDPVCVDGWLAFMIGDALWYPLFDESFLNSTATAIGALLGNNAKVVTSPSTSPAKQTSPVTMRSTTNAALFSPTSTPSAEGRRQSSASSETLQPNTPVSGGIVRQAVGSAQGTPISSARVEVSSMDAAWEILMNPVHSLDHSRLDSMVTELGVTSSELLEYLDEQETLELANVLKPVPRRAFMSHLVWSVLTEHGGESQQIIDKLNELGVKKASQLAHIDGERDLQVIHQSLKLVPAKQFLSRMPRL